MNKKEISKEIEQFATSLRLPGIKKILSGKCKGGCDKRYKL